MLPHPCSARAGRAFKNLQEHVYTRKFTYSRTQTLNHLAGIFAIILMPCVTIKKKSPKTHLSKIASVYFQMKKKKISEKVFGAQFELSLFIFLCVKPFEMFRKKSSRSIKQREKLMMRQGSFGDTKICMKKIGTPLN